MNHLVNKIDNNTTGGGTPLISIIVPCFNVGNYVKQCIDSCLNNVYRNFELILVNDGSTDNTKEIIESYLLDARVKFINKGKSEGVSKARNDGLDIANGDYILFLDSDDWISSDCLSIYFDKIIETNADFIVGRRCVVIQYNDRDDKYNYNPLVIDSYNNNDDIFSGLFSELIGYSVKDIKEWNKNGRLNKKAFDKGFCTGIIYKKSIIEKNNIKFDESITVKEDTFFNLYYLLFSNKLQTVDETVYFYRIRADRSNTVSKVSNESYATYLNKIARSRALNKLRDRVKQEKNIDILPLYSGSTILSLIEVALICNKVKTLKYKDYKNFINIGTVSEASKLIKCSIKNIKFNCILFICKFHMYWLVYFVIKILCKLGLDKYLRANVN